MKTALDFVMDCVSKKEFYNIPHWDKVKMSKIPYIPDFDTGVEHLRAHTIDRNHYLLSQLVVWSGEYKKYELLLVTIHGLQPDGSYYYKTYKPLREVWFY